MPRYAVFRPASTSLKGSNRSQICEQDLAQSMAEKRRRRWLEENREAMDAWNGHVAQHGLPLAAYRQF